MGFPSPDRGSTRCSRCGGERTRRGDGALRCLPCTNLKANKAYYKTCRRRMGFRRFTKEQRELISRTLTNLGREVGEVSYDPDESLGCNDSAWVKRCVNTLAWWIACCGSSPDPSKPIRRYW